MSLNPIHGEVYSINLYMSIKPEKYKYAFYTFKIHVHIDWLTVFKHPLASTSCYAGQVYFIGWVDLAFSSMTLWIGSLTCWLMESTVCKKTSHPTWAHYLVSKPTSHHSFYFIMQALIIINREAVITNFKVFSIKDVWIRTGGGSNTFPLYTANNLYHN